MITISIQTTWIITLFILLILNLSFTITLLIVLKKKSGATVSEAVKETAGTIAGTLGAVLSKFGITNATQFLSTVKNIKTFFDTDDKEQNNG